MRTSETRHRPHRPHLARASRRARRCVPHPRHAPLHHAAHACIGRRADPGALAPDHDPGPPLASLAALVQALLRSPPALRPALPRAVRSAEPSAQSPRRLPSAGFPGVDFPIPRSAPIRLPTRRGGLRGHTPRIGDAKSACARFACPGRPFERQLAPSYVSFLLDRVYALEHTGLSYCNCLETSSSTYALGIRLSQLLRQSCMPCAYARGVPVRDRLARNCCALYHCSHLPSVHRSLQE